MRPWRILFHHRIRADDGQAVHLRELIHALREQGHEVLECALVPKAGTASAQSRRWQRLRLPRLVSEMLEIGYSRRGLKMLLKVGRRFQPDFIYERHALHCRAGLLAARHLGIPLLLEVNAPLCEEMARLELLRFPTLARRTEREVLGLADRVLCVSDVLAGRLADLGAPGSRLRVVRNAADPRRYDGTAGEQAREQARTLRQHLGLAPTDLVVGFVGYMRAWHRLDLALQAMASPDLGNMHLVLAGEGPAAPDLAARARDQGLDHRVHWLGVVPASRLPAVCSAFDIALVPAINEYASPLKVFDALAAGVATLAPDQPNLREIFAHGETGVLFAPGDPEMLSRQLSALAADPGRRRRIGAAGRELLLARDWTWAGNARRVIEAFQEVVP